MRDMRPVCNPLQPKLKIAFLCNQFPKLSETFILNQITGLIDRGHEVDVYAGGAENESELHDVISKYHLLNHTFYYEYMPDNKLLRFKKAAALVRHNFHKGRAAFVRALNVFEFGRDAASLRNVYSIIPFLDRGHYDIIHCQYGPNGDLGVLLRALGIFNAKIVTTFHGYDIRLGLEKGGRIYRRLFNCGDVFIAISPYNYNNLLNLGLDASKIVYHPVGIDLKQFAYKRPAGAAEEGRPIRVLTVARLVQEKGLAYGIHAVRETLQRLPGLNLKYNIIGSGPLDAELTALIRSLKLEEVVYLRGAKNQSQIVAAYKQSDIFLLPSVAEALPVAVMEAQAVGLPVVATMVGSMNKIVLDGETGFCVPPSDADALADRLCFLIDHPEIWPKMGQLGRRHVENNFNIDTLNDRLLDLYVQLLQTKRWGEIHGRTANQ
jgi:colanic acid/amylovoran/stewartan biosynthesis glycosyltransferase WcaL/AmsK/CpsK